MSKKDVKGVDGGAAGDGLPDVGGGGPLAEALGNLRGAAEGLDAGSPTSVEVADYSAFNDGLAKALTPVMEAHEMAEFRVAFTARMELLLTSLEPEELAQILQRNPDTNELGSRLWHAKGVLPEFNEQDSMEEQGRAWAEAAFYYLEDEVGNEGVLRRFAQAVAERMGAVAGWTARHRRGLMGAVALTAAVAGGYTKRDTIGEWVGEKWDAVGGLFDGDDAPAPAAGTPPPRPARAAATPRPNEDEKYCMTGTVNAAASGVSPEALAVMPKGARKPVAAVLYRGGVPGRVETMGFRPTVESAASGKVVVSGALAGCPETSVRMTVDTNPPQPGFSGWTREDAVIDLQ